MADGQAVADEWRGFGRWSREYFAAVRPAVAQRLADWRRRAAAIPTPALRQAALASLEGKWFHCEGGGVFAAPSRDPTGALLDFVVPYQTLCDYLDTVTDRGPSQDPDDLRLLHQALRVAVRPQAGARAYYRLHPDQDDGGYLDELVQASQAALRRLPGLAAVAAPLQRLVDLYVDLQVLKHGPPAQREAALAAWHQRHRDDPAVARLDWWEFAAACGSTLGLFALLGEAARTRQPTAQRIAGLLAVYWPWTAGLHILLDYFVDLEEDAAGGDLNFVRYYPGPVQAAGRMRFLLAQALTHSRSLEDGGFHRFIARGLLGFYLADRKLRRIAARRRWGSSLRLLAGGGSLSWAVWAASLWGRAP